MTPRAAAPVDAGPTRSSAASRCGGGDAAISLPVLKDQRSAKPAIRPSRNGVRRAWVLGVIQALILLHIGLWLLGKQFGWFGGSGRTLSPVEPSETMYTLELGQINAGFIFFAAALLSTLIFGRWVCGWACHVVLLQDLCSWIMKKLGVRPKPFRSRLLVWAPFVLALYMFIWPSFKRLALFPILEAAWPAAATWLKPVAPWTGFSNHLVTESFWATFPVIMAAPTLLIVGFAAVYFLGSKGFCTYGCPYGGFFAPLDEFAPGRIRVDHDKCHQCGHCTATCTSNVRVHEEVREYGMVIDPGCMKCLDCVSVCPNEALSFGFGPPAFRKPAARNAPPRRQYDLSLREELAVAAIFLLAVLGFRGLYLGEGVPLLMAMGLGGIVAFAAFKTWRLFSSADVVRLQNIHLKWRRRITPAGWALAGVTLLLLVLASLNGAGNIATWRADILERRLMAAMPPDVQQALFSPFNGEMVPRQVKDDAARIIAHRRLALGFTEGGLALMSPPDEWLRLSWLHVIRGEWRDAETLLRAYIDHAGPAEHLGADLIKLLLLQRRDREALDYGRSLLAEHPHWTGVAQLVEIVEQNVLPRPPGAR